MPTIQACAIDWRTITVAALKEGAWYLYCEIKGWMQCKDVDQVTSEVVKHLNEFDLTDLKRRFN